MSQQQQQKIPGKIDTINISPLYLVHIHTQFERKAKKLRKDTEIPMKKGIVIRFLIYYCSFALPFVQMLLLLLLVFLKKKYIQKLTIFFYQNPINFIRTE